MRIWSAILSLFKKAPKVDNSVVQSFDLERYIGDWYEIARFDHWFERGVVESKASYSMRDDGKIQVLNSGMKDGEPQTAKGTGKTTDTPGLLRISFFGPFYSDYRVMMIDETYSAALVGNGSADYLWILSRKPQLDEKAKDALLTEAKRRGYDMSRLLWVRQNILDQQTSPEPALVYLEEPISFQMNRDVINREKKESICATGTGVNAECTITYLGWERFFEPNYLFHAYVNLFDKGERNYSITFNTESVCTEIVDLANSETMISKVDFLSHPVYYDSHSQKTIVKKNGKEKAMMQDSNVLATISQKIENRHSYQIQITPFCKLDIRYILLYISDRIKGEMDVYATAGEP